VRDDEDAVVAQRVFVGTEAAAELRPGAQGGKEIGGDAEGVRHLGRLARLGEAHVRGGIAGDLAVAARLRLEVEVVGRRDAAATILARRAIDALQSIAVGIGRRAQLVAVEDAEHRGVGPDAESEREDGNEGEARRATQRLDGEAKVTDDGESAAHDSLSQGSFMAISASPVKQIARQAAPAPHGAAG
jgi:hypothetical protein